MGGESACMKYTHGEKKECRKGQARSLSDARTKLPYSSSIEVQSGRTPLRQVRVEIL